MLENLTIALELLALGWGGVFVVMAVIYLMSLALARLFPPGKDG